jgi:two-component system, OmpR family, response regulator
VTPSPAPHSVGSGSSAGQVRLRHSDGSAVRVLVVDDEPTLAELLSMALRYEGW